MKKVVTLLLIFFFSGLTNAQNKTIDSLLHVTEVLADSDTNKVFNYCNIALNYGNDEEFDKALEFTHKAEQIISKCNSKRIIALFNYVSGHINYFKLNYKESLSYLLKAIKYYEEIGNKRRLALTYSLVGLIYQDQTFYGEADVFLKKSLDLRIELKDSANLSGAYSNLGLNYFKWAQKKQTHTTNSYEIKEAFKYLSLAYEIAHQLKLSRAEATALGNLSNLMNDQKQFKEALKYATRAHEIYQNIGETYDENISLIDIGNVYLSQNKTKEAVTYFESAMNLSLKNNYKDLERYAHNNLWQAYERMGDYKNAFFYHHKERALHDSVFNKENLRQINEMQIKYETDKKESENVMLTMKNELSDKAIKNQKLIIFSVIGGLALTILFAFFIFRGLNKQKQANRIISLQKKEVEDKNQLINEQHQLLEEKQKEIIDSIYYAKRIQRAHLPTDKYIGKNLDKLKKNSG